jgi:hypothetical protein
MAQDEAARKGTGKAVIAPWRRSDGSLHERNPPLVIKTKAFPHNQTLFAADEFVGGYCFRVSKGAGAPHSVSSPRDPT